MAQARKTAMEKREEASDAQRERDVRAGNMFTVSWSMDGLAYGPLPFLTEQAALAKRDEMIAEMEKPIPRDYYERQAHLTKMLVRVERYEGGRWVRIVDSEHECVCGIVYADGDGGH